MELMTHSDSENSRERSNGTLEKPASLSYTHIPYAITPTDSHFNFQLSVFNQNEMARTRGTCQPAKSVLVGKPE